MQLRRRDRQMNLSRVIRPVESAKRRVVSFSNLSLTRKPKGEQDCNHHARTVMFGSTPILYDRYVPKWKSNYIQLNDPSVM